ncbi:MAG: peptidoglycan DD-metalloendopeptidase family protein [Anaerolineaceae bacterium]|nr:peptidoglycan DD-metalloendopeptidase family protein [Anaerolineaceae bacterium]MDD4043711.1 peptidoglycan DD-metalloendopeptidase family protein [Anaerolineaceae bacterium]MDD4578608.1 peptidoglycan DD-metalloendopeptidase family protein [Anaerolineaceae bacterium]
MKNRNNKSLILTILAIIVIILGGCGPRRESGYILPETLTANSTATPEATSTPASKRPVYAPGTLVDYTAQSGDSLGLLSLRFGCTPEEILRANLQIPNDVTTLPPGFPMQMPIYYKEFWGTDFQVIPDAAFVYGPDLLDFDLTAFLQSTPGWFKNYRASVDGVRLDAAGMLNYYGQSFSLNPKLLLALVEYQTGALTNPVRDPSVEDTFLGFDNNHRSVHLQISYVSDLLNDGFYRYFNGEMTSIEHRNGTIENIDPWQNAATAALQYYFSLIYEGDDYGEAIGPGGLAKTFTDLFGDPWRRNTTVLPGSLLQPELILPFKAGTVWSYTGGPHSGWGNRKPWSAIDFAPPTETQGCVRTEQFAVAVADGVVARTGPGLVMLDLDGDGDERTGWVIMYLHVAEEGRVRVGQELKQGDPVGRPSCEGGSATGTHVHIARKYNGQWLPAASAVLPFVMNGWLPVEGSSAYQGLLVRGSQVVRASVLSDTQSMVPAQN